MDQDPRGITPGNYPPLTRLNSDLDIEGEKMRRLITILLLFLSVFLVPL
jgi:hypothetical protein